MSRTLVGHWPFFSSRGMLRPLLGASAVRSMEDSPERVAQAPATAARDVQPAPRSPFAVADRDHDWKSVDAVAGSEFVDDRIRLRE